MAASLQRFVAAFCCVVLLTIFQIQQVYSFPTIGKDVVRSPTTIYASSAVETVKDSLSVEQFTQSKRQVALFDGAELGSIVSFLANEDITNAPDVAARAPKKVNRVGSMTFVMGTITTAEKESRRIVAVESNTNGSNGDDTTTKLCEGTVVYTDSIATVPQGISDADAIATAAAALCGVHCGAPILNTDNEQDEQLGSGKAVVIGGGDYACFTARGLEAVGAKVSLVTARPGVKLTNSEVKIMDPSGGDSNNGFSKAVGKYDSLIDTIGDDANFGGMRSLVKDESSELATNLLESKLNEEHSCRRYISTITRSQQYVLTEGLLFARDPVLKFQKEVEKKIKPSQYQSIPPPKDFGTFTVQRLLNKGVIYKAGKNENGGHANKQSFVRGWSLSDLAEVNTFPNTSSGTASVRFGFPLVEKKVARKSTNNNNKIPESASELEAQMEKARLEAKINNDATKPQSIVPKKKRTSLSNALKGKNPVTEIDGLQGLNSEIISQEQDCVLFVAASYCRTCKALTPSYNRMARETKDLMFAKADIAGPVGRLLANMLAVEAVPSFVLFKQGKEYGQPMRIKNLPSKELDLAMELMTSGKEWDPVPFEECTRKLKRKTKK